MGRLRWMQNVRTSDFEEGELIQDGKYLYFGDENAYIYNSASGTLVISATTLTLSGTTGITTTSSATSGNLEPMLFTTTMSGAGATGGRVKSSLTINAALGAWSNAIKGEVTYGASGSTTGLGSVVCAEMTLSAGTSSGTYAPLEVELNLGSSASTGTQTSLGYFSVNGDDASTFDTNGYIFSIQGLTSGSGKVFYANKSVPFDAFLRIDVGGTDYFIGLTAQQTAAT